MSDRIDHTATARSILDYVGETPLTSDTAQTSVTAAQVHATLALVEQQRIANLIALDRKLEQYTVPADDETGEEAYVSTRLRTDIREGLGL